MSEPKDVHVVNQDGGIDTVKAESFGELLGLLEDRLDDTRNHTESPLTSARVIKIMHECLFREDEEVVDPIIVEGIMSKYGFNPERIEQHRADIRAMLRELPAEFNAGTGGGWSFLNMCMDKRGDQWTGLHQNQEYLFALGAAAGMAKIQFPREMWSMLHGGMPYILVDTRDKTLDTEASTRED